MPRQDRRGPARTVFGKPDVAMPEGSEDHVRITEVGNRRQPSQESAEEIAFLAPHPNATVFPGALKTSYDDTPGDNQQRNVTEVYETMPGPWIPFSRYDVHLGVVNGKKRRVQNTGQVGARTATSETSYESRGGSAIVMWETVEEYGSAIDGFTAFPIVTAPIEYDEVRGSVSSTSQIVVKTGSEVGSVEISTDTSATVVGYAITNPGSSYESAPTVTFAAPGGAGVRATGTATVGSGGVLTLTITNPGSGYTSAPAITFSDGGGSDAAATAILSKTVTRIRYEAHDQFHLRKITETWAIPGPTIITTKPDPESGILIGEGRTLMAYADITPGNVLSSDVDATAILSVTERERSGIAAVLATRVVTTYPPAAAYSSTYAIEEEKIRPYTFPGRVDESILDSYGSAVGHKKPSAELVSHTIKTWWVNATTKPTIAITVINPNTIYANDVRYDNVLHNSFTRLYNGNSVNVAASTPDYATFLTWIGTSKVIDGSSTELRRYRWKVQTISVVMR